MIRDSNDLTCCFRSGGSSLNATVSHSSTEGGDGVDLNVARDRLNSTSNGSTPRFEPEGANSSIAGDDGEAFERPR